MEDNFHPNISIRVNKCLPLSKGPGRVSQDYDAALCKAGLCRVLAHKPEAGPNQLRECFITNWFTLERIDSNVDTYLRLIP